MVNLKQLHNYIAQLFFRVTTFPISSPFGCYVDLKSNLMLNLKSIKFSNVISEMLSHNKVHSALPTLGIFPQNVHSRGFQNPLGIWGKLGDFVFFNYLGKISVFSMKIGDFF